MPIQRRSSLVKRSTPEAAERSVDDAACHRLQVRYASPAGFGNIDLALRLTCLAGPGQFCGSCDDAPGVSPGVDAAPA